MEKEGNASALKRPAQEADIVRDELDPPEKKNKEVDFTFSEVKFKFLVKDEATITDGLEQFIEVATAYSDGVKCQDVVEGYCKSSPDCAELLSLLDVTQKKLKSAQIALVFECLRHILIRINADLESFSATGEVIVQRILAAHMAQIYNSLRDQNKSNTVKAAIQLLIAIVMLNDRSKKAVQARFNFDHHVFPTLFARRNRKDSEDVRSCLVLLTMAFLVEGDRQVVNTLVQQKTFLQLTLSGLKFDSREVVVDVLATLLDKVLRGSGISKTLKIKLFSEKVLKQLCALYKWEGPGGWKRDMGRKQENVEARLMDQEGFKEEREIVATTVHEFLCELCSSQKYGIVFFDKLYGVGKRNLNQILTHFLQFLSSMLDEPLKRDLALRIMSSCPDQVEHFLPHLEKFLIPRWSEKWMMYMDFIIKVYQGLGRSPSGSDIEGKDINSIVSMTSTFCLPPSKLCHILAQAIRHDDLRVRHQCLLLCHVMLKKAETISNTFKSSRTFKTSNSSENINDAFITAVSKSLPSPSAVFHCVDKMVELMQGKDKEKGLDIHVGFAAHLMVILQILNQYQALLPSVMSDRPKDVVKLIEAVGKFQTFADPPGEDVEKEMDVDGEDCPEKINQEQSRQSSLAQIYLLRLLSNTDSRDISLGREGLLEKLLRSAHQNVEGKHKGQIIALVCKMLTRMEAFAMHEKELQMWISWALKLESSSASLQGTQSSFALSSDKQKSTPSPKKKIKGKADDQTIISTPDSSSFSCITFLSRCLATLINDPVPYLDRITEAVVDATSSFSSDHEVESSSAGTNEGVIDAILLTEDKELDQCVANSAIQMDTSPTSENETSIPISPLTFIAMDNLQYSKTESQSMADYVGMVLIHTLHLQTDPIVFCTAVRKCRGKLGAGVREYLESFGAGKKHDPGILPTMMMDQFLPWSSQLMKLALKSLPSPKEDAKFLKELKPVMLSSSFFEKCAFLDQAIFYLTQFTRWKGLDPKERKSRVKLLQDVAELLFSGIIEDATVEGKEDKHNVDGDEQATKMQEQNADSEEFSLFNYRESRGKINAVVERILGHPVVCNLFLTESQREQSLSPKKSVAILSKTVSEFICKILVKCKDLSFSLSCSVLIDKYSGIALRGLRNGQDIDLCMRSLEALSCHMEFPALTKCVSDALTVPLHFFVEDSEDELHSGSSPLSSSGQIFLQMLNRLLKLIEGLSVKADSFLFPWSSANSKFWTQTEFVATTSSSSTAAGQQSYSSHPSSDSIEPDGTSDQQTVATSTLTLSLDISKLTPLFKLLLHCVDENLISYICRLVSLVPSSASACPENIFQHLIKDCTSCSETMEQLIQSLISHNRDAHVLFGVFVSKNGKILMKKGKWRLMVAFLQGDKSETDCLGKMIQALRQEVQGHIKKEFLNKDENLWLFLTQLVSHDAGPDVVFRHFLYDAVKNFVSENALSATKNHFDLLYQVVSSLEESKMNYGKLDLLSMKSDSGKKKNSKSPKISIEPNRRIDDSFLDFLLNHLMFLLSKKAHRNADFEEKLLDLSTQAMFQGRHRPTQNFIVSTWAPFVKSTLKNIFINHRLLKLLAIMVPVAYAGQSDKADKVSVRQRVQLDPKSMFQLCISHTSFLSTLLSDSSTLAKKELVNLLHSLFLVDSECVEDKLGHVFMTAYSASLSQTDQRLLHMMQAFIRRAETKEEMPVLWGNTALEHRSMSQSLGPSLDTGASVKTFLDQIDPVRMSRTILQFPQRRNCQDFNEQDASNFMSESECYDPNCLLSIFIQILSPDKIVPIHHFVAKDCLGFLLVSLTSHHPRNRLMAYKVLNGFYSHLDNSRCSEKQELAYILDILNASRGKDNQRLSFVVALFLARVVKLMLYPSDHMYLTVLKFLTAKPEMDLSNVPEFYKLFFSAESHFRLERNWILTLLRDGIRDSSDYWLYQKKVIFRIIMAFFSSSLGDETSQGLVLETIRNACSQKATCVDLVKEHSLMSWLAVSVKGLTRRAYLVDVFSDLIHTVWHSLSSKAFPKEGRNTSSTTTIPSEKYEENDEENVEKSAEELETKTIGRLEMENFSDGEEDEIIGIVKESSWKDGKFRHGKKAPMIPKSTIVEMGLVVKLFIWHLNSASSSSMLKILQVIESLNRASSSLYPKHREQTDKCEKDASSIAPLCLMTSSHGHSDTSSTQQGNPRLFKLSPTELLVLVYFTAKNVNDNSTMARASTALQKQNNFSLETIGIFRVGEGSRTKVESTKTAASASYKTMEEDEEQQEEEEEPVGSAKMDETEDDLEKEFNDLEDSSKIASSEKDNIDPDKLREALQAVLLAY